MLPLTTRGRTRLARLAVAWLAAGIYAGTLGHGFVYDDAVIIQDQEVVRNHRFASAFATPYHTGPSTRVETGAYRPLTILTFAVQHALHGDHPPPYHALNVALHALVSLLALEVALVLGLSLAAAAATALLFAVHPIHAEAVAGIAGRADLLAAAFALAALLAWTKHRDPATGRLHRGPLALCAAATTLALLAKESAVVLPGVFLAWDLVVARRRPTAAALGITVLPVAAYLALRGIVLGGLLPSAGSLTPFENPVAGLPWGERLLTATAIAGRYAVLLLVPARSSPDWGWAEVLPVASAFDPHVVLGVAAALVVLLAFARGVTRHPRAAFALAFGAITYAIVSNIVVVIGTGMGERLVYLPSLALALLFGIGLEALRRHVPIPALAIAAAVVLTGACLRTVTVASFWKDDLTLFSAAERSAPRSLRVLVNLGVELARRGRTAEGRERLERAVSLAPDHVPARINLAAIRLAAGDLQGAEGAIRHALRLEPANPIALAQLGVVLLRQGRAAEAVPPLEAAARLAPQDASIRRNLELARASAPQPSLRSR